MGDEPAQLATSTLPTRDLAGMAAPYNPRRISDSQMKALGRSLRYFGTVEPIIVNRRSNQIVGGHQRVKAAKLEEIEDLPVVWVDLDEPSEKQLNLALNRISGDWEDEGLREVLLGLDREGADLALTGFEDAELARLLQTVQDGETAADDIPEDVEERCQPGDVWQLGPHWLMCGDSTSADDVRRLLTPSKPQLTVTDPPYGVEYDPSWRNVAAEKGQLAYAASRVGEVKNDEQADWREAWALVPGDVIYAWSASGDLSIHAGLALIESGYQIRNQIVWRKPHFPISRGHYTYQHEPCWYAVRKGGRAHWIGDATQSSVWEVSLDANVPGGHSTQKPVELFRRAIANHQGDVYEPFCGSGTCVIACEQIGRTCHAMEIDPHYCDVTLARWEAFTGKQAERADDSTASVT